ncbi:GNAT family N-acetyltransferase [Wenyingzhuangia sp. IMCC45533]
MNKLSGNLVKLRAIEPEDLDFLYKIENNESYWEVSDTQQPFSKYLLKQYIKNSHLDIYEAKQLRFIIVNLQDIAVGTIDLFDFNSQHARAGVGILIQENFRKMGYAKQALELMHQYAFSKLNLHQLFANIATDNIYSIRLFETLNYQKSGIKKNWIYSNNQYKDVAFYQILKSQS